MRLLTWTFAMVLLAAAGPVDAAVRFAQGEFDGDGTSSRAVTGVGFRPDVVMVVGENNEPAMLRSSTMGPAIAKPLGPNESVLVDRILSLDADGFSVGSDASVNASGTRFHWIALKGSTGLLHLGAYTGDGIDDRSIDVGFSPVYVIVMAENNDQAMQRFLDEPIDASLPFDSTDEKPDRIQDFTPTGFQVGKHNTVNENGRAYHWIAFAPSAITHQIGTYVGDDSPNRSITGLSFAPEGLFVKSAEPEVSLLRSESMTGDSAIPVAGGDPRLNTILDLTADGFVVGSDKTVNEGSKTIHWLSLRDTPEADVTLSAVVDDARPAEGDTVQFDLGVDNLGPADASGVVLEASLDEGLSLISASGSRGSFDGGTHFWNLGDLPMGANESLSLRARVDLGTRGQTLDLVARLASLDQVDPVAVNDTTRASVSVADSADLALDMSIAPAAIDEGEEFEVLASVSNLGPGRADGATVSIDLPAGLSYVSDAPEVGFYDSGTGQWNVGPLAPGATATLRLRGRAGAGTAGSTIPIAGEVDSGSPDPSPASDVDSVNLRILAADLAVRVVPSRSSANVGDSIDWTVEVINLGPDDTESATATVTPSVYLGEVSHDASQGSYSTLTDVWDLGAVAAGDTARLVLDTVALAGSAGELLRVEAEVSSSSVDPDLSNNASQSDLSVLAADLSVDLTAPRSAADPGEALTYTVSASNLGPDDASQATVDVGVPPGLTVQGSSTQRGVYDEASGAWSLGTLAAGETIELDVVVRLDPGTEGSDLTTTASIEAPEADLVASNDSDSHVLHVRAIDLAMRKEVSNVAPDEGELITYTLSVENLGPDPASGVEVTDVLPPETTFVSAVPSRGSYTEATGLWSVGPIAVGETATLALIATIDAGTAGAVVDNQAQITASGEVDVNAANDTDSASLTVFSADLALSQSVDVIAPNEGDTVTFTVDVENLGPNDVTGVQVASPLVAGLTYVAATPDQGSYDPGTGLWTVGSLASGQTASLSLAADVDGGTAGVSLTQVSTIVAASLSDPVADNDEAATTLTVFSADLRANLEADLIEPDEGDSVVFTATITNLGPNLATGVALAESLATGLSLVSAVPSAGSFDPGAGLWSLASLASGATDTLTLTATVDAATAGRTLTSAVSITTSDLVDPVTANDRASVDLAVRATDLRLTLPSSPSPVNAGELVEWSLQIDNLGPSALDSASVVVTLDPALAVEGWSASHGSFETSTGVWSLAALSADSSGSLVLSTRAGTAPAGSTLPVTGAKVSSRPVDPQPGNDSATGSVRVASADLVVDKRVETSVTEIGETVVFSITLANRGPDEVTGVAVVDSLPVGLSPAASSTDLGVYDPLTGRWTVDSLPVGNTGRLELQATVDDGTSGQTLTNTARIVEADQADPLLVDNVDVASVEVRMADLALSAETSDASVAVGDTASVTFRLKNRGPGLATGARISLVSDEGLEPLEALVDGSWDPGVGVWSLATLASGATAELTLELAVTDLQQKRAVRGVTASVVALDQQDPDSGNDGARAEYEIIEPLGGLELRISQTGRDLVPGAAPVELARLSIENNKVLPDTLVSLRWEDVSNALGSAEQLDASWQPLTLVAEDREGGSSSATVQAGVAEFTGLRLALPAGSRLDLSLRGGASLVARDGDSLDLALARGGPSFTSGDTVRTLESSDTSAVFEVDGLSANQIRMVPLGSEGLRTGMARQKVLEFILPANGYQSDVLQKLNLAQYGTARASTPDSTLDIGTLEAWADEGSGDLEPDLDTRLGSFSFTGDRWELTGMAHAVPLNGVRVFVTADIEAFADVGRTVELGLPGPPDPGVGMASDNDGPVDRAPEPATPRSIIASDRVTIAASAGRPDVVSPGEGSVALFDLLLSNSYASDRTLRRLEIENATEGSGTQAELDEAFELLTLRLDGNSDGGLDDLETDPVLATGALVDGSIVFDALSTTVPSNATLGLFVEVRVSETAADGDLLRLRLGGPSDVDFVESSSVAGSWPVVGHARRVDGMVAKQVHLRDFGSDTLGALEGPALAFDFTIPANGYRDDVLRGLTLENEGSATEADIAELRLWRDDGDGLFESGDDIDLGPLTALSSRWQTTLLDEPLPGGSSRRFFVGVTVASAPTDSVTLQLRIPLGGITVESGNDGPIDRVIRAPQVRLLSSAPLLASLEFDRATSVIGDRVESRMVLRNVGSEEILSIVPEAFDLTADGILGLASGPVPSRIDLSPGEVDTLRWSLDAVGSGSVSVRGSASGTGRDSGLERRALKATSADHRVYVEASTIGLHPAAAAPSTVARGQEGIVPFTFTFDHAAASEVSDVEIQSLRLRFEDEQRAPVDVADLLASVRVSEGTNHYGSVESFAAGDSVVRLFFDPPVRVTTSEPVTLSVQLALSPVTVVRAFHVTLEGASSIAARDVNSARPVDVALLSGSYPLRSGLATVRAEVTELRLALVPSAQPHVAPASTGVPLLLLEGENPGIGELTSDVEVEALEVEVLDETGRGVTSTAQLLSRLRVVSAGVVSADLSVGAEADSVISVDLSPRIRIPVGAPVDLRIEGDLDEDLRPTTFGARVRLSSIRALDSTARDPVPVVAPDDPLAGEMVRVELPARRVRVASVEGVSPTTIIGETGVTALRFTVRHPSEAGTGALRLDSLRVAIRDQLRAPTPLSGTIDRLRVLLDGVPLASATDFSEVSDRIDLDLGRLSFAAGETAELLLEIDVEASAPDSFFELWLPNEGFVAVDANSGQPVALEPETGAELPLASGLSRLRAPAREMTVSLDSRAPAVIVPGQPDVEFATLTLRNPAAQDATSIDVERITIGLRDAGLQPRSADTAITSLRLVREGGVADEVSGAVLDSSSVELVLATPLAVPPGEERSLVLRADLAPSIAIEGLVFELDDGGVEVSQPTSALLGIDVVAAPGRSFPFRTESANLSSPGLDRSFSNFPNPFAAGRSGTTFAFHLRGDAEVTLRIFTVLGERVITLLDETRQSEGLHQDLVWDGRNGRGDVVRNGVYLARIRARFDDGSTEETMRKVAVRR